MTRFRVLSLLIISLGVGMGGWGGPGGIIRPAHGQVLPPGQEEAEGAVKKKPPFYGLGLELSAWDQTGIWAGGGAYRNDLGFLLIPSWNVGQRFIGHGPFKTLSISARFAFSVPLAGFEDSSYTGDAPQLSGQLPCATGRDPSIQQVNTPRCDFASGPRRVDYSDISLIVSNPRIYTIPKALIHIDPLISFTLPASAESRLQTLVIGFLAQVGAGREFWKNRISVGYSVGIGKGFYQYNSGQVGGTGSPYTATTRYDVEPLALGLSNFYNDPGRADLLCAGGSGSGCIAAAFYLQNSFRAAVNFTSKLNLTVLYRISDSYVNNRSHCTDTVPFDMGQPISSCQNDGAVAGSVPDVYWTDSQLLWSSLNYEALSWLNVNLSYIVAAPFWQYPKCNSSTGCPVGDGQGTRTYRQGLYSVDANDFSSISLGVSLSTDTLLAKIMRKN